MNRPYLLILTALLLAACSARGDDGPITASVIGGALKLADPAKLPTDAGDEAMLGATAQGLVAFDAEGRIEPALAERWIITDDGLSMIFRIRRAEWADGSKVTGRQVADRLRAIIGPGSRHPLKPLFTGVEQVIAMTGQVIELRLRVPQPELLQLLAQPDMAIFKDVATKGTGPYRVHSVRNGVTRLRPVPSAMIEEDAEDRGDKDDIRVRGEAANLAVARFQARDIELVTGGGFNDLALARAARPAASQFKVDPVFGLFGFAVTPDSKALADGDVRRALAMAIDRERIVKSFGISSWRAAYSVLPARLDGGAAPAALEWAGLSQAERSNRARNVVGSRSLDPIRVAMPTGPGARLLFAAVAADWRKIGVEARAVQMNAPADLRLIDEVAPQSAALWYLQRLSCARRLPCDPVMETALAAGLSAASIKTRADAIAETDARLAERQIFIPIALPLRWSLVSPAMIGWRDSAFGVHAFQHLRGAGR